MPNTTQQRTSGGGWRGRTKRYREEQNQRARENRARRADYEAAVEANMVDERSRAIAQGVPWR